MNDLKTIKLMLVVFASALLLISAVCVSLVIRVNRLEETPLRNAKNIESILCGQQKINRLIHRRLLDLEGSSSVPELPVAPECGE